MEYYFSDPRYARLDNKAVLTVWNTTNFINAFGGTSGAKKAVDFMEEELKKIGYDGIILLSSTQGATSSDSYENLAEIGFTASYGYHWGANGANAEHQISCNTSCIQNANGISHHIPTVSIGFNDVGRNETRDPIITAEDHLKVCQYIKDALSEFDTDTWKDNTLFISTWNEYSEGTYVLPTESNGFSYLENIRKTFTADTSDHTALDVRPTQNQLDRIGHLYPPNHSPIRWYQFEKSSDQVREDPSLTNFVSVKAYDISDKNAEKAWKAGHGLDSYRVRDGVIMGKSSKSDFAVMSSDRFEVINAKDAPIVHIRMKNDQLASFEIFFITDSDSNWSSNKQKSAKITATGEFVDYYINMSSVSTWSGKIKGLRIDPQTAPGSFEIALIEFMNFPEVDETAIPSVMVNGVELNFTFDPEMLSDGDILVCGEAKKYGFYSALRLYHEWDRFTGDGVLTLHTFDEKTLVFTVGSDKVIIDGKEVDAGFTFKLRDGLPQFHIQKLCKLLGYKYTVNGNTIKIQAATDKEYEVMINAIPNQWEFEDNGVQEGWKSMNCSILAENGFLTITPSGSDVAIIHDTSFDADDYTHMVLGIVYDPTFMVGAQLFFTTTSGTSYSADRCINANYNVAGKKAGDIVEAVFDLSLASSFSGTITGVRIDPYTSMSSAKIAYVRFVTMEEEEKEEIHEWSFNKDGDTEGWSKQNISDATFTVKDGYLIGTGTNSDPAVKLVTTLEAENYTKLTVGIKYSANLVGRAGGVYFTTSASPSWAADKYAEAKYVFPENVKEGDTIEVTFDLSACKLWNSIITAIRFDMFGAPESFAIDYIRLD